jgi:hypothetical protein
MELAPEEYLTDLATARLESILVRDGCIAPDKLKAEALCQMSLHAAQISMEMFKHRDSAKVGAIATKRILSSLKRICEWSACLILSQSGEAPTVEDIEMLADDMDDDIRQDTILACMYIQGSLRDLSDVAFSEVPPEDEEVIFPAEEILAYTLAIAGRVGRSFEDLVSDRSL